MDWKDKILNSDAGRGAPEKAKELIEQVSSKEPEVVYTLLPRRSQSALELSSVPPVFKDE